MESPSCAPLPWSAQPLMRPPETKACFELFGVDVAMSAAGDVWIIEVNRSPRVKLEDKPMMHALLNIAAPRYGLPQPGSVWDPLDVDPDATWGDHATTPEAEAEEERTWGRRRWGPGGENGEKAELDMYRALQSKGPKGLAKMLVKRYKAEHKES